MTQPLVLFGLAIPKILFSAKDMLAIGVLTLCFAISVQADVKEIDFRQKTEENKYFLVFAARGDSEEGKSITGHAFVIWGIEDHKANSSSYKAWGFYPQDLSPLGQVRAIFGQVPGNIVDEVLKGSLRTVSDTLIVRVDRADYDKAEKVLNMWAVGKTFQLGAGDCLDFLMEVGESIGLPMPTRFIMTEFPQRYLKEFVGSVEPKYHHVYSDGSVYDGPRINLMLFGRGTITSSDKSRYEGMFRMSAFDGHGTYFSASGDRFEGDFKKGYLNGETTVTFADGSMMRGDFTQGTLNGRGSAVFADGRKYEGIFKQGLLDGTGKITLPDGTVAVGTFEKGQLHGQAKIRLSDGNLIESNYQHGKLDGTGKMTYSDGSVFEGQFFKGSLGENVKISYPNGDRFEGIYQNGALRSGTLTEKNGTQWQGSIVNGKLDGPGTYVKDGVTRQGVYRNGAFNYHSDPEEPNGIERSINVPEKKYRVSLDLSGPYQITEKSPQGRIIDQRIIGPRN
jgi:hypothetical protein